MVLCSGKDRLAKTLKPGSFQFRGSLRIGKCSLRLNCSVQPTIALAGQSVVVANSRKISCFSKNGDPKWTAALQTRSVHKKPLLALSPIVTFVSVSG